MKKAARVKLKVQQYSNEPNLIEIYEQEIDDLTAQLKAERKVSVQTVMDLFFALKKIGGRPRLVDLIKLAKRIRGPKIES